MKHPIVVKVVFHELSEEAAEEFSHYVRSGLLVVQAEVTKDPDGIFKKTVRGERLVFPPFKSFFETSARPNFKPNRAGALAEWRLL